jgi:type II secretion system protein I
MVKIVENVKNTTICNPQSKGFTLLEVMVAVVIMATVLVTLIGLKNRSMQDVLLAEHMTMATLLAKNKMFETLALLAPTSSKKLQPPLEDEGDFADDERLKEYTWKRALSKIPLPDVSSIAGVSFITEVRIAVLWKEGTRQETVELVSYE